MAYLSILCWVPFLLSRRSEVLYHAKQGVTLFLCELLGAFVVWILDMTFGRIVVLGVLIQIVTRLAFYLPALALTVLGFARALAGENKPLPWIGQFAESLPDPPQ